MIICVTLNPCLHRCIFLDEEVRPAETVRVSGGFWLAGGKGVNVARVVRRLGGESLALHFAGGMKGDILQKVLAAEGIPVAAVDTASPTRFGLFIYQTEGGEKAWREILEEGSNVTASECRSLLALLAKHLPQAEHLCLSGSSPSGAVDFLYTEMIRMAKAAGVPVLLDSYGPTLAEAVAAGPDLIKINQGEMVQTFGAEMSAVELYGQLRKAGGKTLIITAGAEPVQLFHDRMRYALTPPHIAPVNPIGSGDCLAAALVQARYEGWDMLPAVSFGLAAAAANTSKLHLCAIDRAEVEGFIGQVGITGQDGEPL